MAHGGNRKGAGRKKGGQNKLTEEAVRKAEAGGLMPLDYLLSVMRDGNQDQDKRVDAAKAAAPYVHPRLAAVTHSGDENSPLRLEVTWQASSE